jgi:hypothetical protein
MAIRYAVDLTDTERAALREIISKNRLFAMFEARGLA